MTKSEIGSFDLLGPDQPEVMGRTQQSWKNAARPGVTPLETKAVYVAGLVRHLAESAGYCLDSQLHIASYVLTADAIEAFGRVAQPGANSAHEGLKAGLGKIAGLPRGDEHGVVATTSHGAYSVRECINRRDFTAHGGAIILKGTVLDEELTVRLLCLLVSALDSWWADLLVSTDVQRALALADVVPLSASGSVVFVDDLAEPLLSGAMPGGVLLHQSWRSGC